MEYARDRFYISVGAAIRTAREAQSVKQRELAKCAGVTKSAIDKAESGVTCSLLLLAKLAEAMDCTIDELVPLDALP